MQIDILQGWTGVLDFRLLADGIPVDLTGAVSIVLVLNKADGSNVTITGTVSIIDAVNGKIRFTPGQNDFDVLFGQSYSGRFKVTDSTGKIVFFPSVGGDSWNVRKY